MHGRVIDCNVLAAANGLASHAGPECELVSALELRSAASGLVFIDDGGRILQEYRSKANAGRGQPGPADLFLRWLYQAAGNRRYLRIVTLAQASSGEFSDYPRDTEFGTFDPDDRVYVAVAIASGARPTIVNATDSDWQLIRGPLLRYGVVVNTLCTPSPGEQPAWQGQQRSAAIASRPARGAPRRGRQRNRR